MLSKIDKDSREFTQVASNLMDNVGDAAKYGADLTDSMDLMIEDLTALHDSLDMYYPDLQASLDDLSELVNRTTDAMNKGISTMTIVQNTLKATSGDIDEAAKNSLRGDVYKRQGQIHRRTGRLHDPLSHLSGNFLLPGLRQAGKHPPPGLFLILQYLHLKQKSRYG